MVYVASTTRYQEMKYNRCGKSGLKMPAISLGTWQHFGESDAYAINRAIVCRAFDLGITHIDLANMANLPGQRKKSSVEYCVPIYNAIEMS